MDLCQCLGGGVSSILDRSTAGNDQNEDTEGASGGDVEGGEEMIEADRGTDDIPPEIPPPPGVVLGPSDREQAGSGASGISIPSLDHVPTREVVQPIQVCALPYCVYMCLDIMKK